MYFNSRPSARGDGTLCGKRTRRPISIHAPPRGATSPPNNPAVTQKISIHAPPRGATRALPPREPSSRYFNSRPSARGDRTAPRAAAGFSFQFTPLREGRRNGYACRVVRGIFQFTPLREGRPFGTFPLAYPRRFQFTPLREGRPANIKSMRRKMKIFQFTPLREGRHLTIDYGVKPEQFQFTPLREGRRRGLHIQAAIRHYFNSRPSARGDSPALPRPAGAGYFNSRPSARGDG